MAEPARAFAGGRSGWSGAKGAAPAQAAVAAAKTAAKLAGRAAGGGGGRAVAGTGDADDAVAWIGADDDSDPPQSCPGLLVNGDMPVAAASGSASSARMFWSPFPWQCMTPYFGGCASLSGLLAGALAESGKSEGNLGTLGD
jgi:hypothetical protein